MLKKLHLAEDTGEPLFLGHVPTPVVFVHVAHFEDGAWLPHIARRQQGSRRALVPRVLVAPRRLDHHLLTGLRLKLLLWGRLLLQFVVIVSV